MNIIEEPSILDFSSILDDMTLTFFEIVEIICAESYSNKFENKCRY